LTSALSSTPQLAVSEIVRRRAVLNGLDTFRDFEVEKLPDKLPTADELIASRLKQFAKRDAYEKASKLIKVKVNVEGPIGIVHFGDPHIDDDGSDMPLLKRHVEIVRKTPGMFGANIGDYNNNWVGRLAALYGKQSVKAAEATVLVRWLIGALKWLYLIGGNHDAWSGEGSAIEWFAAQDGALFRRDGARLALQFPNGTEIRINARHSWPGRSQWNPAHGEAKSAMMGAKDHIILGGHTHTCGYNVVFDETTDILSHCIQVGSYKVYDDFAKQCGFRNGNFSPAVVTIIDPHAKNEIGKVQVMWDVEQAADYLTWMRKKRSITTSKVV
jgi:hypothetical protein